MLSLCKLLAEATNQVRADGQMNTYCMIPKEFSRDLSFYVVLKYSHCGAFCKLSSPLKCNSLV